MISNKNLINIKVVEVMKIYNFYFGHERCVTFVNNVIITLSYEEMINTKVVDLDELFNFDIYYFFS